MNITRKHIQRFARTSLALGVAAGLSLAAVSPAFVLAGCEEKKKKAPPPPPPPPPPAPIAPDPIQVDPVLQSMKPDARVQFPQGAAPYSEDLAKAIITLASDFAKGDATAVRTHMAPADQMTLDALVGSGDWEESTKKIEGVRVVGTMHAGPDSPAATFGLAFQEQGAAYVVGFAAFKNGSDWLFSGASSPTESKPRASDFDGVSIGGSFAPAAFFDEPESDTDRPRNSSDNAGDAPSESESTQPAEDRTTKPRRKNTPSGPVTIPGSPPGSG